MADMMDNKAPSPQKLRWVNLGLTLLLLAVFTVWLVFTPEGVDGKLHAAGYSVCHQMESHSFSVGGKFLPLCSRCTGTFLGVMVSMAYLGVKNRGAGVPSRWKIAVLAVFFILFAVDGINSSLTLLPGLQPFYPPSNYTRLGSGLLFSIALANLVIPLWNQTLWHDEVPTAVFSHWKQLGWLMLFNGIIFLLVIANIPFLYYPIAILSILSIFVILSMVYSLLWCIILKKEKSMHLFRDGMRIFIAGITTAILQIGVMDLIRYLLSGTW